MQTATAHSTHVHAPPFALWRSRAAVRAPTLAHCRWMSAVSRTAVSRAPLLARYHQSTAQDIIRVGKGIFAHTHTPISHPLLGISPKGM